MKHYIIAMGCYGSRPGYPGEPKIAGRRIFIPPKRDIIALIQLSWWQIMTNHDEHMTMSWLCHDHHSESCTCLSSARSAHRTTPRWRWTTRNDGERWGTTKRNVATNTSNAVVGFNMFNWKHTTGDHMDCNVFALLNFMHWIIEHLSFWQWNWWQRLEAIPHVNTKAGCDLALLSWNMFAATLTLLRVWLQVAMKIKLMLLPQLKYCS